MLSFLSIENFALVDNLQVDFGGGLNLITGETGSGKSILVDAVGLLVGARASQEMIRSGFDLSRVEGLFRLAPDHPVLQRLAASGIPAEAGELIIRRDISASGSNKVFINGVLSTLGLLAEIGSDLADIHGQHDQQQLLSPRTHLWFLDAYGEHETLLTRLASVFREMTSAQTELERIRSTEQERLRELDNIRFQIQEIRNLKLEPGLDRALERERALLASSEKRAVAARKSYKALYDAEESALAQLNTALKSLESVLETDDTLSQAVRSISEARYQLEEVAFQVRDYLDSIRFSPARLEAVQERLAEIQRAGRKYGQSADEMLAFVAQIEKKAELLADEENQLESLCTRYDQLHGEYLKSAHKLSQARGETARRLSRQVEAELAQLAMEKTVFSVSIETSEDTPTEQGIDSVEFLISANPGETPKPMAKIASGGELSRIVLALKSILTLETYTKTLVFDEVDAGIGGRVASVLAEKLGALAIHHQVFCVTHLPQIAASAARHFHVGKSEKNGRTRVDLKLLEASDRIEELARMLAGKKVTETALQQAREMLAERTPESRA